MTRSHRLTWPDLHGLAPWAFVLMWASGAIFAELGLRYATPLPFLTVRAVLAAAIGWTIAWSIDRRVGQTRPASVSAWALTITVGLVMQGGYQGMFFLALYLGVAPGTLAAVLGMQPILTAAFTGARQAPWTGLAFGLAGLVLVVADAIDPGDLQSARGMLAAIGALLCITVGTIAQQRLSRTGLWTSIAIQHSSAALLFALLAVIWGQLEIPAEPLFWTATAWMVLVVSTGATGLLFTMVRHGDATRVSSLFYLVPPVTVLLDLAVYGHVPGLYQWAGTVLIVFALVLIKRPSSADER